MPFFRADVTFRLSDAAVRQPWKDDVVLGPQAAGAHIGKRTCIMWAGNEGELRAQIGRPDFVLDGPAAGEVSYSVEDRNLTVLDPVETAYFDRDPSADEEGDPDLDDRAPGWYFRYATDGEDGWSGAHESEEDAFLEARSQNLDDRDLSLESRDRAHASALSAAARIATLLGDGPDRAADHGGYRQLRALHVALDQALASRFVSARRHEISTRLAAEIDALEDPAPEPTTGPGASACGRAFMVRFTVEVHDGIMPGDAPLVRFAEAFAANLLAHGEFQALCSRTGDAAEAPDVEATILLCGTDAFARWEVEPGCVGLLAITSGPFERDDAEESGHCRRHVIAVNVETSERVSDEILDDGEPPSLVVESWAATIAHEAVHLAFLVRHGDGMTPHGIYSDEGDWGIHQATKLEGTEWDPVTNEEDEYDPDAREEAIEELVEATARAWTPELMPGGPVLDAVLDHLGARGTRAAP